MSVIHMSDRDHSRWRALMAMAEEATVQRCRAEEQVNRLRLKEVEAWTELDEFAQQLAKRNPTT